YHLSVPFNPWSSNHISSIHNFVMVNFDTLLSATADLNHPLAEEAFDHLKQEIQHTLTLPVAEDIPMPDGVESHRLTIPETRVLVP
ncbi:hypothetical protein CPB97_004011, partial [Podila verticillata]